MLAVSIVIKSGSGTPITTPNIGCFKSNLIRNGQHMGQAFSQPEAFYIGSDYNGLSVKKISARPTFISG